ncbi:InlB B-repeat-containing protein, partial [Clostridium beijerinckii]
VTEGANATAPSPNPTRNGYTFAGWDKVFTNITEDTVVTATYTENVPNSYTVTFKDYDGTVIAIQTVTEGAGATAPTPNPTRNGYTFAGWDKVFANITEDTVVTATYTENIPNSYTVTFKDYDGTVIAIQTVTEGASATAPTPNPTRNGYIFAGWDKVFTNITGNTVVTATYTENIPNSYTVTFKDYNGTVIAIQTVTEGASATAPTPNPTRNGYTFAGWDKGFANITEDTVVTATYTENIPNSYTVTFKDYDGTVIAIQTVTEGAGATAPTTNPTRNGYTFAGWDKVFTNITENTVVTATYTENNEETHTLTYTAGENGTIIGVTSQVVNEGEDGTEVSAVPDTGYHFANWSDGKTNASRMDTNVHDDISVSAEFEIDLPNDTDTTTPAAVRISGNQKVDNTLEALLIDENGLSVTTSSAVTYKWYRISGNDADNGTLVGEGSTYKLISSDIGKYIKLVVSYIDKTFEKITSKISGNSSSGSSGSSGHSSSSTSSSNTSSTEKITVKVTDGKSDTSISQTVIERTTSSDGTKKDTVTYTPDKAKETIAALSSSGKDTARIVATDTDTDVSETKVNIPKETLTALSSGNVNLQIETGGAIVSLPKESVQGLAQSGQLNGDLYFRLVPIKDETKQTEIKTTANQQATIKAVSGNNGVQVLGTPMTIETNMSQRAVDIVLPLKGITIPTDATERQAFLNDLGVFIEHSDGEKVLEKGQVVEYAAGVFGIKFTVNKFSDFTIVKLNKNNQTGWKLDNGYWYFFDNAGTMITGWYKSGSGDWVYDGKDTVGQWFHLGRDGRMDTGWFKDSDGTWYYLCDGKNYGALGYMETGWKFIDGKWYFLKSNGAMATDWTYVEGSWYYLYSDGSMAGNTEIDGYRLDTSGAWINN